jgi:hypothetical protein
MFLANDDHVLRLLPIFPTEDKNLFENQVFEFKGHKSKIIYIRDTIQEDKRFTSIDLDGLVLTWLLVEEDEKFKFVLDKKTKIFQEGTQIVSGVSRGNLLLIQFRNNSFILYLIDRE